MRWAALRALVVVGLVAGEAGAGAPRVERWKISDLGTLGPGYRDSSASGINGRGQIVGASGTASGIQRAFLWQNGRMRSLGTLGGSSSGASAINERGQVIGTSLTSKPARSHAFLWQNGKLTDLGTLGGGERGPAAPTRA